MGWWVRCHSIILALTNRHQKPMNRICHSTPWSIHVKLHRLKIWGPPQELKVNFFGILRLYLACVHSNSLNSYWFVFYLHWRCTVFCRMTTRTLSCPWNCTVWTWRRHCHAVRTVGSITWILPRPTGKVTSGGQNRPLAPQIRPQRIAECWWKRPAVLPRPAKGARVRTQVAVGPEQMKHCLLLMPRTTLGTARTRNVTVALPHVLPTWNCQYIHLSTEIVTASLLPKPVILWSQRTGKKNEALLYQVDLPRPLSTACLWVPPVKEACL